MPEKAQFMNSSNQKDALVNKFKAKEMIQKAVLLEGCQKLLLGNINEAYSIVYDSIRIAQTNKDNGTINLGLLYLIQIYYLKEDFQQVFKTLREFFSLNLEEKSPLIILQGCLLFLKLEQEFSPV